MTGRLPFDGATPQAILEKIATQPPKLTPSTPPELAAIITRALSRAPRDRYSTTGELADDIARFLDGQPVKVYTYSSVERIRRFMSQWTLSIGAAWLIVLVSTGLLLLAWQEMKTSEQSATLHIDDARISKAHAMISLRGRELRLLSLRGLFAVGSQPVNALTLKAGQHIALARGVEIVIEEVALPDQVLAISGDGLPSQVLSGVCALQLHPKPRLLSGDHEGATLLWNTGDRWRIRQPDQPSRDLNIGDSWTSDGRRFQAVSVSLAIAGQEATRVRGRVQSPLRIICHYDTVHIHRANEPIFSLSGISARLISALAPIETLIHWEAIADEIWPGRNRLSLRRLWDVSLTRLRKKLQGAGIRPNLIRSDHSGNVELLHYPDDTVEDQS